MIDIVVVRPLPPLARRGDADPIAEVRFFADDESALAATISAGLGQRRPASEPR